VRQAADRFAGNRSDAMSRDRGGARDGGVLGHSDARGVHHGEPAIPDVVELPQLCLSDGCTAEGWIEVAAPIDSRVEATAGGRTWTAWTATHSGYGGARAPVVHVVIGAEQTVERITVTTTSGAVHTVAGPIEARRRVYVEGAPGVVVEAGRGLLGSL